MARLLIVICVIGTSGCNNHHGPAHSMPNTKVRIWLDQPLAKIEGMTWPTEGQELADSNAIDVDAHITLYFPSGRKYSTLSKTTFLSQEGGIVSRVVATPLAETVTFGQAVAKVKAITEDLGIQKDERVAAIIRSFESHPPEWDKFHSKPLGCDVEKGIEVFIEIKPAYEKGKWFISCGFYVSRFFTSK